MSAGPGGVKYENVDQDYLDKRKLRKSAGWVLLWALGVGAVISGDYFGWNFGLGAGGFGGLLVATFFIAIMYICMVFALPKCPPHCHTPAAFTHLRVMRLALDWPT